MPMNTRGRSARCAGSASAWSRISDAVRLRPKRIWPGRAERAGERAARLRRDADRAAAVAVAHQHRLHRMAVVRAEERLHRAVVRLSPRSTSSSVENGTARSSRPRSESGRFVICVVAGGPAGSPLPHLAGPVRRLSVLSQVQLQQRHDPRWPGSAARGSSPPAVAEGRASYLADEAE